MNSCRGRSRAHCMFFMVLVAGASSGCMADPPDTNESEPVVHVAGNDVAIAANVSNLSQSPDAPCCQAPGVAPSPVEACVPTHLPGEGECFKPPKGFYGCWTNEELTNYVFTPSERFCPPDRKSELGFILIELPFIRGENRNCDDGVAIRRLSGQSAEHRSLCEPYCLDPANRSKPGCELF